MRVRRTSWDGSGVGQAARALRAASAPPPELAERVAEIIAAVRERGDEALHELTSRHDATDVPPGPIAVPREGIARARADLEPGLARALELCAANLRACAEAERERGAGRATTLAQGQRVEVVEHPVRAAGAYAPGGRAAYPSSVLMCAVPAAVAGVDRIVLASPPGPDGRLPGVTLAAAAIAEVHEVYGLGGAQAIAALALGTETVAAVDLVVGPGNAWVTEAKRQLYGAVGIDGLAGPSELVVVADGSADPWQVTLDLLAQAEHGEESPLALICTDGETLDRVAELVRDAGGVRPTVAEATVSLVEAPSLYAALELADAVAPEHLELSFDGADRETASERVAGCVFVGAGAATAFGDYAAGSNHVLPTGAAARFGRPLGAYSFMRRTSVVELDADAAAQLAPAVVAIAEAEGLPVHGESATARAGGAGGE